MTREFRVKLLRENRDDASTTIHAETDDDAIKQARRFTRANNVVFPAFHVIHREGHRGLYIEALSKSNTGAIITEIFA